MYGDSASGEPVWKSDLKTFCHKYGIEFDDIVGNRQIQQRRQLLNELEKYAASNIRLYIENGQHNRILTMIQSALNCSYTGKSKLNEQLMNAEIPYRIESGRGTTFLDRNKIYWRIVSVK